MKKILLSSFVLVGSLFAQNIDLNKYKQWHINASDYSEITFIGKKSTKDSLFFETNDSGYSDNTKFKYTLENDILTLIEDERNSKVKETWKVINRIETPLVGGFVLEIVPISGSKETKKLNMYPID